MRAVCSATQQPLRRFGMPVGVLVLLLVFLLPWSRPAPAEAHGPLFGWGPRTIWANGYAVGVELETDVTAREAASELGYHFGYGITEDWQVGAKLHQETHDLLSPSSLGNVTVRSRYRFYYRAVEGALYHATALVGAELPTGTSEHAIDAPDVFGGLAAGYEGRRWLFFGAARYRRRGTTDVGADRGNTFRYDFSAGIRPVRTGYYQPDLVLMAEIGGQVFGASRVNGDPRAGAVGDRPSRSVNDGGHRLLAGFGAWLTYRNLALKLGIQVPIASTLARGSFDYQALLEFELHF